MCHLHTLIFYCWVWPLVFPGQLLLLSLNSQKLLALLICLSVPNSASRAGLKG